MADYFKINGTLIKTPQNFKDEYYRITKSNRLQNGDMSMEMIAKKRKFYLTYEVIAAEDLKKILGLVWSPWNPYYTFEYFSDDHTWHKCKVYAGALSKSVAKAHKVNEWAWKDFELRLIEV